MLRGLFSQILGVKCVQKYVKRGFFLFIMKKDERKKDKISVTSDNSTLLALKTKNQVSTFQIHHLLNALY